MTKVGDKIIVALDVATKTKALDLVEQLRGDISFFKIGLQLYTAEGPEIVRTVRATGANVFLDLKLHDIPNTVALAVESAAQLEIQMLTIHLSGGEAMIRAAVSAKPRDVLLLGVTVLTSADGETIRQTGIPDKIEHHVLRLAKLGVENGIDGVVASPHEITMLRREFSDKIKIVVPGIRPGRLESADQKRVMTPREAIHAGADYLVIGRPIIAHPRPSEAAARILSGISS
jgi:orotidine-5'-phosphate decarboxylase